MSEIFYVIKEKGVFFLGIADRWNDVLIARSEIQKKINYPVSIWGMLPYDPYVELLFKRIKKTCKPYLMRKDCYQDTGEVRTQLQEARLHYAHALIHLAAKQAIPATEPFYETGVVVCISELCDDKPGLLLLPGDTRKLPTGACPRCLPGLTWDTFELIANNHSPKRGTL